MQFNNGLVAATAKSNALHVRLVRSGGLPGTFDANFPLASALDVDGNGVADALTDGLIAIRYLFGLRGNALIQNAIGPGATRTTAAQIENYLRSVTPSQ